MKEKLYTIPVSDAFKEDCECTLCFMHKTLEHNAIEFTMGPSYMEDDVREVTNEIGFCSKHIPMLYNNQNRLGLALMLSTHMEKTIKDLEKISKSSKPSAGFFQKKPKENSVSDYINHIHDNCFICNNINEVFKRYLITILYLYRTEAEFKKTFRKSKGFCLNHYKMLYTLAPNELSGSTYQDFIEDLNTLFLSNMKRVHEDLTWFIDKFDYRYANEPWKNSKDALPRSILKMNSEEIG